MILTEYCASDRENCDQNQSIHTDDRRTDESCRRNLGSFGFPGQRSEYFGEV